ncbi:hypothetical protein SAPIO_CDS1445 [Scedosporium apiospermum]|uniref:Glycosyl hydrolase family 43 protein n=1 Tax=Pseudallescheria apiosperma TaxID=563466 RepID=A0A084GEB3_PSEDA|nr:uncharacterized protein SAPIO_CDS1445 [Scedosporium apiospermum]KEZ45675.1 hypothetical protein SAPIO_CDS1445 [Scedosporium apiospermum]
MRSLTPLIALGTPFLALASSTVPQALAPRQEAEAPKWNFTDYAYFYFRGESRPDGEQVYIAVSNNNDPGSWTTLNNGKPILISDVGYYKGIRDPVLIPNHDRTKYWVISTDLKVYDYGWSSRFCFTCQGTHGIVIWESEDLITWTGPTYPTVSPENAGMTWAPDAIWHPEKEAYQVFWTSKLDGADALHIMRSFTTDFKNFTVGERYVDRGMDATIAYADDTGKYYFISKNGPAEGIEHSTADSLEGPWTKLGDRIGLNKMKAGEGPLIFRNNVNPDKWHLWIDAYLDGGGYVPFETEDIESGKWTPSEGYKLPADPRHGSVVPITAAEREALVTLGENMLARKG